MAQRLQLQSLLEGVTEHVYFQPPNNISMQYPCIVYARDGSATEHADNQMYTHIKRYQVTVIDRNPDSSLPDIVEGLDFCQFDRFFAADNLNHWVYTLFF